MSLSATLHELCNVRYRGSVFMEPELRIAAMDAYLWNHGDTDAAKARLTNIVAKDEVKFVGLPRKTAHMTEAARKDFDQRVTGFYKTYPEELPPPPPVKE